jgi:hypothetical protein
MRMSWSRPASIALGLLLPLPLVVALGSTWPLWDRSTSAPRGKSISPLLSWSERHELLSFERPCRTSKDCDPPLGCLDIDGGGNSFCVASECLSDLQCPEGFTCRVLKSWGDGLLVRFCVPRGKVSEGTLCVEAPANNLGACRPGLICAGWCGRPCQLDDPSSCPQGSFCANSLNGPACLPSCTEDSCLSGQQCIRFNEAVSACATVAGENCQRTPCPKERKCTYSYSPGHNRVQMECVSPCDEKAPSCPGGHICFWSACRRLCDRAGLAACEPGDQCVYLPVEKISMCLPQGD